MINTLNSLIINVASMLPKPIVKQFAGKYVAGETDRNALKIIKQLNDSGYSATLDILGEHTKSIDESNLITNQYIELFDKINDLNLDCNISVKPSHIGLDLNETFIFDNLTKLHSQASAVNNFLRIDMESSSATDVTIKLFNTLYSTSKNVGTVFQAYLHRTFDDIKSLPREGVNFRLCKGIYNEPHDIAIQDRKDINKNYLKILKYAFENNHYVGIATHDLELIEDIYTLINDYNIPSSQFEFQILYGVPMKGWLEKHKENNFKVRVYVPFGEDWYDYSIRRLKENPNIAGYVLKNLFR